MKKFSLVLLAFILTLTFTASDLVVEKGIKPDAAKKCPYLESHQLNNSQLQCPYLSRTEKGSSGCPYMNEKSEAQNGCPFLEGKTDECPYMNGNADECPYLKQHGEEVIRVIKTHPLPEGKNT